MIVLLLATHRTPLDSIKHLTTQEVLEVLNVSKNKLTDLIKKGEIIVFRKGKFSYSYPREQFTLEYIRKKQEEKKSSTKLRLKKGL